MTVIPLTAPDTPWEGAIFMGNGVVAQCNIFREYGINYAKTAEPIELPFGDGEQVGPRNRVLDGRAHWRHLANTVVRLFTATSAWVCHQAILFSLIWPSWLPSLPLNYSSCGCRGHSGCYSYACFNVCVAVWVSTASLAKTAEPIEMP